MRDSIGANRLAGAALAIAIAAFVAPAASVAAAASGAPATAIPPGEPAFANLERRAIGRLAASDPVAASMAGLHEYDGLLPDYAPAAVRRDARALGALWREVRAMRPSDLSRERRLDRELLAGLLEARLRVLEVERAHVHSPAMYATVVQTAVEVLLVHPYGPRERQVRLMIARLHAVPRLLGQAKANLARPPALGCAIADRQLQEFPSLLQASLPRWAGGAPKALRDSLQAAIVAASDGISGYREKLDDLGEQGGNDYALGEANYTWRLRHVFGLDLDGPRLAELGERWFGEIRAGMASLEARRRELNVTDPPPVRAPQGFTREQLLASYRAEVDSMREFVRRRRLVTIPADIGPMVLVPTPASMRATTPGQAMQPPLPLDTTTVSTYYLGSALPDTLTPANRDNLYNGMLNRRLRGGALHEGYPGHHLQLSIAKRRGSLTRRFCQDNTLVEGWALYCEELMGRHGVYGSDSLRWLPRVLGGMRFRAARVLIDAKLHCGRMTYEEAVVLMKGVSRDTSTVASEVSRYVIDPTQPMSYLLGKSMILALKDEVRRREGRAFSERKFHDRLLSYGSIPVAWIARDWIGRVPAPDRIRDLTPMGATAK
ncbi:MAG: DUF885 domain-containing protein [Candidatus Eisenbacteria bacterium]|nr:DUF885 domain-containing protein [Candidatus Eisenbacteria bacterium]